MDEKIIARLQALEVLLMEQEKRIEVLEKEIKRKENKQTVYC